ncbi:MAG: hypothetical protein RRZ34_01475 [Malacoplasma sp.]
MYYRTHYKKNRIDKICKSSQLRNNIVFKEKVFLNQKQIPLEIISLKSNKDILDFLACKKNWDDDKVFLFKNKKKFSTLFFKSNVDIVCCNMKWQIVDIINNCEPNSEIKCHPKTRNIWVMKENLSIFLDLKLNKKLTYYSI